ncbi:MAG TPA: response regulator [Bryobacteraceae bacterium]
MRESSRINASRYNPVAGAGRLETISLDTLAQRPQNRESGDSLGFSKGQPDKTGDHRDLVLVVEDNQADVFLVEQAVALRKLPIRLLVLDNGDDAMRYFAQTDVDSASRCPDAILLDLNLPRRSGREVLEHVKRTVRCRDVPVIILTSSNSPEDRRETAALGAIRYFRKPTSYQEFLKIGEVLEEVLAQHRH